MLTLILESSTIDKSTAADVKFALARCDTLCQTRPLVHT
jgi:hypothetical protein